MELVWMFLYWRITLLRKGIEKMYMTKKSQGISKNKKVIKKIKVAILETEPLFWTTPANRFLSVILDDYQWTKNNTTYNITTRFISDKGILKGKLKTSNFDALLIPGGGVGDGHSITKGFNSSIKVRKWKKNIQDFIKDGGGCIGICGGATLITPLSMGENRKPTTFVERQNNKSSLGISCVIAYYKYLAIPLFYLFQWNDPEKIGTTAYVFSSEPGVTEDGKRIHTGGVPVDFKVNKDNPIFSDYPDDNIRIRWWGGPALILPKNPDRDISILAKYPEVEICENKSNRLYAWRYTGGVHGLIFAFFKALKFIKNNKLNLLDFSMLTYYFAGNWELTDKVIETDLADRPAITAEIYPNENKGRIILCTPHPAYMIWWGGHIEKQNDNGFNCLATGLYKWQDITKLSEPIDDNLTYTWWLVRRFVAWAAKIPDEDLPPIMKQKVSEENKSILSKNIFWDGTLLNQIQNI